ncbi:MAG: rhodanese-like domain-containing protein [Actinomycetia bacterium]|nr:rhodanese-like domain-containing protein [Actinomycetes bacterium]
MLSRAAASLAALIAVLAVLLTGCGGSSGTGGSSHVNADNATVIDVRTPAEYAAGHLRGAIDIDLAGADFAAKIDALPRGGSYLLYCASGVRAGQAATIMRQDGFTDVTNLGGMQDAAKKTGLPVVTT